MLSRITSWVERRIDPFAPHDASQTPPEGVWAFMWFYLRPVKWWLVVVAVTAFAFSALEASVYIFLGWFVDALAHATPATVWQDKGWLLIGMALVILICRPLLFMINNGVMGQILAPQLTNMIRWRAHHYVLGHQLSYFQDDFAGRLAARVIQVGQSIRQVVLEVIGDLFFVAAFALAAIGMFASVSAWLVVPVLIWLSLYALLLRYVVPRALVRSEAISDARSHTTGRIVDAYTNILTVKLFARSDLERSSVRQALERWTRAFLDLNWLNNTIIVMLQTINSVLIVAVGAFSLWFWMEGQMSTGEVSAGMGLTLRLVQMSGWVMREIQGIFENIGTVQESMETIAKPHGLIDRPDARPLVVTEGALSFENIRFNYGKQRPLFENLSLAIRPGEKVGLVGPSGAGKSTLVSLMLRLHDLEGGTILIDGQDIAGVTQDSVREAIAVVTQDTALLHRSIRDNIAYGRFDASDEEVARAAGHAEAHDFIMHLEDARGRRDYAAHVGERGVKLSGGQRQRIAIARVILKNAPFLVLDEATSALDSDAEAAIQGQLDHLMAGKTVIAIAHRLSTIAALDRLVVMDKGRIVEEGSHAALLARSGLYARLWSRQSGGFLALDDAAHT